MKEGGTVGVASPCIPSLLCLVGTKMSSSQLDIPRWCLPILQPGDPTGTAEDGGGEAEERGSAFRGSGPAG